MASSPVLTPVYRPPKPLPAIPQKKSVATVTQSQPVDATTQKIA